MNRAEIKKLLTLLQNIYPKYAPYRGDDAAAAWYVALKPYGYDEAKVAALAESRESGYPPTAGDILARLPPPPSAPDIDKYLEGSFLMLSRWKRFRELYHAAGLPTWEEAQKDGWSFGNWRAVRSKTEPFSTLAGIADEAEMRKIEDDFARRMGITLPDIREIA